jgi:CubicO group peptidase (beta-lactamase class C family)
MKIFGLGRSLLVALLLAPGASAFAAEPKIGPTLQPFVEENTLPGAVTLVADVDRELSLETVGYADVAAKKPMPQDAMFWIASMTKPITGAAVMMLVDEGKVQLDDPVEKYLPEFQGIMVVAERTPDKLVLKKPTKPVTVRNILNHTSGLAHFSPLERPKLDWWPLEVRVRTYPLSPLEFEPESKYAYSNQGINTAGRIVEVVSGKSFEAFLDERLFQPLGMKDTTFFPSEAQTARIAKSYQLKDSGPPSEVEIQYLTYPLTDKQRTSMPGGGLFSTAHDVGLFGRMVLAGGEFGGKRYLSEAAVKEMTSLQTGDLPTAYGLGWSVDRNSKTFSHGGAYGTNLRVDPERGLVTVFMVQYAGGKNEAWRKVLPAFLKAAQEIEK